MREADAARRRPIEYRGNHRTGLADKGDVAGRWRDMREAGVEPNPGHDDADAIGTDEAHEVWPGGIERRLLQGAAACAQLGEASGDHDRRLGAALTELGDKPWHCRRRR